VIVRRLIPFGAFFFVALEAAPEGADTFAQVLSESAQSTDTKDEDYDRQYDQQFPDSNLLEHLSSLWFFITE
jgi:hypothetical protein